LKISLKTLRFEDFNLENAANVNKWTRKYISIPLLSKTQSEAIANNETKVDYSIIIPTYNESQNILRLIRSLEDCLPPDIPSEILVVDDNSPDGTGKIVEKYVRDSNSLIRVIHRQDKRGLVSAILDGIANSKGQYLIVMDADFSHPPETVRDIVRELNRDPGCIVVASRYVEGGSIKGWPFKRRLISSGAVKIARHGLKVYNVKDPMSGFFAVPRRLMQNIRINSSGYKILLEILVKTRGTRVKEIPYTFVDRKSGKSKLDLNVVIDYTRAVWHLYRYGQHTEKKLQSEKTQQRRKSVIFLSKAGRFYTVGASGLLLNYLISIILLQSSIPNLGYMQSTLIGIIVSNLSNFFLNKVWTFEDKNFRFRHTIRQYGLFAAFSSGGIVIQLITLYLLVQSGLSYAISLIIAVALASISNFLLNKKWTFREKFWG
jgi:dolichol-phosphate mannosyltransferase